jgi:phage-related holin
MSSRFSLASLAQLANRSCWFCPFILFIEKYLFADWQFLHFLAVLVFIDTFLGFWKGYLTARVSSKAFAFLFTKVIIYGCFLIVVHTLTHFTVKGEVNPFFQWLDSFAYAAILVRESISILENMAMIRPGLIPKTILKRLKQYEKEASSPSSSTSNPV